MGSGFVARYQADPEKSVYHYLNTSQRGLVYLSANSDTVHQVPDNATVLRDSMLLDGSFNGFGSAVDDILRLVAEAVGFEERTVPGRIAGHIKTVLAATETRYIPVRVFIRFCYTTLVEVYERGVSCSPLDMDGIIGRNLIELGYFQDAFWMADEDLGSVRERLSANLSFVDLTDVNGQARDRTALSNQCRDMWFKDEQGVAYPDHEQNRWRMLTERYCQDQNLEMRRKVPYFIFEQLFTSGKPRYSVIDKSPATASEDSSLSSEVEPTSLVPEEGIGAPVESVSWPGSDLPEEAQTPPEIDQEEAQEQPMPQESPVHALGADPVPEEPDDAIIENAPEVTETVESDSGDVQEAINTLSEMADAMEEAAQTESPTPGPKVPASIPSLDQLNDMGNVPRNADGVLSFEELSTRYQLILDTYKEFGIAVLATEKIEESFVEGPASVLYRVRPGAGVDYRRIRDKADALKLALALEEDQNIRFSIDRGFVTIDVPKSDIDRFFVSALELWSKWTFTDNILSVPIGLDSLGNVVTINFSSSNSPHLLIAGTTGSGKSEALNTILGGLVNYYSPDRLRLLLVDPKGTELGHFGESPFLEGEIGWDETDAIHLLDHAFTEMQGRYRTFRDAGKRSLQEYNGAVATNERLPWWLIVLDEYADLTSNSDDKKKIEQLLKRLAQKARAAGIHVIIATQKPSGDVISTNLRSNLPAQLALRVKSNTESRVIMDDNGAEALNGKGDAFLKCEGRVTRIQCAKT
ncbi:MAG: DNA translocase FtsK [Candidatus Latescibacteria bacterium]|nr:DNA translocase FtsK [Candidatus Latescibacterota bacterium]